ncbi:MAG: cation transporter [Chloroflexi bacterium RBG_16_51_16]|nr:MAG: cation transporter [Chloroflexi bacterium RBG_16_51_16]
MNQSSTFMNYKGEMRLIKTRLSLSLWITLAFVLVEAAAGLFANSLALLTDAAHNLTDVLALGLSWYAVWLSSRPATNRRTYGNHRAGILVALFNSTTLVLISFGIFYEAYRRFMAPPDVRSEVLIGVGLIAILVNLVTALLIRRGSEGDLNLRSAFTHLMGDVMSTIGAVIAGVIIYFTNANWLDPFVSVLIGFIIIYNAWGILRETVEILLESTPRDLDMQSMVDEIKSIDGVLGVHDLHVWSLTKNLRTMSAHVLTENLSISNGAEIQSNINEILSRRYNISHATLQLECVDCEPDSLYCDIDDKQDVLLSKNLIGH